MAKLVKFPDNFLWGTATASYQIEGGMKDDGKGESIWDSFSHTPGKIKNGDTGDVACDHYHLWQNDISLMKSLGYKSYRFSLSWPRIIPNGGGNVNQAGLDFYNRLVDALLAAEITPLVTLYHWDLPTALLDGWLDRSIVRAFAEYTATVVHSLGDRVKTWFTINEPFCASHLGYTYGEHAPGLKDRAKGLLAAHHLLLAHGLAVQEIRSAWQDVKVGIILNLSPVYNDPDAPVEREIIRRIDGESNRWFLDPVFGRGYPKDMLIDYVREGLIDSMEPDFIQPGDMDIISQETDFLGINYYTRFVASALDGNIGDPDNFYRKTFLPEQMTEMGWELYSHGLFEILERVNKEYHPRQIMVTENGASYSDGPDKYGRVIDNRRIDYLHNHIYAVWQAIQAGIPVSAYLVWSFMDNFEWAYGYSQRFGLIYVDFESQKRYPKDSAFWFGEVNKLNTLPIQ